jgi:Sodium:dicarboxylate symporter family
MINADKNQDVKEPTSANEAPLSSWTGAASTVDVGRFGARGRNTSDAGMVARSFAKSLGYLNSSGFRSTCSDALPSAPMSPRHRNRIRLPSSSISSQTHSSGLLGRQCPQLHFIAVLCGFALTWIGPRAQPFLDLVEVVSSMLFNVVATVMWAAPLGAFDAIASPSANSAPGPCYHSASSSAAST